MTIKENYHLIDSDWAIKKASDPFEIWTYNDGNGESIGTKVQIPKLAGLVIKLSDVVRTPAELTEIRTRRPIIDLAFGRKSKLTLSTEIIDAAITRGGEQDPIAKEVREVDSRGIDLCWAFPLEALHPVIDLSDIDQDYLYQVPSYSYTSAQCENTD